MSKLIALASTIAGAIVALAVSHLMRRSERLNRARYFPLPFLSTAELLLAYEKGLRDPQLIKTEYIKRWDDQCMGELNFAAATSTVS